MSQSPPIKAAVLFVQCLEREGVKVIFGIPGEENLDLLEALADSPIEFVLTRHEQAAGFMAATYGRLTGKVGVCLSTLGPGATNFVTAAAYAQLGGMPMLMITGQKPIRTSKQGQFQIVDIVDMMKPLTKFTAQIVSGDGVPAKVREAFRVAAEERPGAAHLELPEDVAADSVTDQPFSQSVVRRPTVESKAIAKAAEVLRQAKRPLVVIAAGANRKLTARQLKSFIEETGIPFVTTQMGKGVVDERHELFLGNATLSDHDFVHQAIGHADVILNVGHDVVEKPPFFMRGDDLQVIHVNFSSAEVDRVYHPQVELVGDIANALWQLRQVLERNPEWETSCFLAARDAMRAHIAERQDDEGFPLLPQRLVRDVRQAVPEDGIVTLDNGMYKIWFARNYPAYMPNSLLLDNALATMGAGLPSAIAAKIVFPDRAVVSIAGDGGFMMNSQELETAVRHELDLVVVILNDGALGMIQWKQKHMGFRNYGLEYGNPDFVAYAESYGAKGHRVGATGELEPLIKACLSSGGVHVIDVPVDYSENHRILNEELPKLSAKV